MSSPDACPDSEAVLSEREAFLAMTEFVWQYARRTDDDLITLLGDIEVEADRGPTDPAAWDGWLECVRHVKAGLPSRSERS